MRIQILIDIKDSFFHKYIDQLKNNIKPLKHRIKIINSPIVTASSIKRELKQQKKLALYNNKNPDKFYVSDKPRRFNNLAKLFLLNEDLKSLLILSLIKIKFIVY